MIHAIVPYEWNPKLQEFVKLPLDDAEPVVIEASRKFTGTNATAVEVAQMLQSTYHSTR